MLESQAAPTADGQNPASAAPEACAAFAKKFMEDWRTASRAAGITGRVFGNWNKYYARDDGHAGWADDLYPEGADGEKVRMRVNVARNLIQHLLAMTISQRPVIDPKAVNTDIASIKQTEIARAVADHYLKTEKVYKHVDDAVEIALATAPAFVHGWWDDSAGGTFIAPPQDGAAPLADGQAPPAPVARGDISCGVLTSLDVAYDLRVSTSRDILECVVREWKDCYDLAALHPNVAVAIMAAPRRGSSLGSVFDNDLPTPGRSSAQVLSSNLIEVCTYYHRKTPSCPNGRKLTFLQATGDWLEDGPLPYTRIPLFRIAASEVVGTAIGYSPMTELASMQEALDGAWSAICSRIKAHGVANLIVQRGSGIEVSSMTGGFNVIEVDSVKPGDEPVKVLELLQVPEALKDFTAGITQAMESMSGVNAVVRGNPPPGVDAGVAIAQFQAMAVQFASRIEQSYSEAIEDLVLWIFEALQTHSESVPRVAQLVGKSKRETLVEFYGKDLGGICKVSADLGNPLSRTAAGRAMVADYLRNSGIPVTPEQFIEVLNTGNLEPATEGVVSEMNLIRQENEMLADGQQVSAMRGENHMIHIREHRAILSNPDIKFSPLAQIVEEHLAQHEQLWMMGDPLLGIAMGAIPMGAGAMAPPSPNGPPGGAAAPHAGPPTGGHPPSAPPGGPPHMHAPPAKGPGPGELPKVMEPQPLGAVGVHA